MAKNSFPIVLYPNLPIDRQVQLLWSRPKSRMQLIGVLLICALISAIATLLLWQRIGWLGFPVLLQSKSCLKFLVELVSKLTGETMPNPYANAPDLEPEEQWTEATAKQMAERQERLHYDRYAQR